MAVTGLTYKQGDGVNTAFYYMASSASGQDEPNRALWLATRVGKMEPSCPLGATRCIPQANFHQKPYNKSFIDQVCTVKMAGYWPRSFFASLWTETKSRSINKQKKQLNLANIQPSWPHTWSITHTYVAGLFDIFILLHIWQNCVCFGDFLRMRILCDAYHKEFESH